MAEPSLISVLYVQSYVFAENNLCSSCRYSLDANRPGGFSIRSRDARGHGEQSARPISTTGNVAAHRTPVLTKRIAWPTYFRPPTAASGPLSSSVAGTPQRQPTTATATVVHVSCSFLHVNFAWTTWFFP